MNFLVVFIGGGLGALIRYCLSLVMPKLTYIPESTLAANFFGCLIATFVFTYLLYKSNLDSSYKLFLITGFCGGLSTLSALSLELLEFIQSGEYIRALIYTITTFFVCIVSVILGLFLVKHSVKL